MMAADKSSLSSLCGKIDSVANLSECRDKKSWITLIDAAIREHERILSMPVGENGCPNIPVRYHRTCRSTFTHKKDLLKLSGQDEKEDLRSSEPRRSLRDSVAEESIILPKHCIFCKKDKYKPKSTTREKTHSCMAFRADEKGKKSAMLHVELCAEMSNTIKVVLGLCAKDFISSEAKYHGSCYKMFLCVLSKSNKTFVDEDFNNIGGSGLDDVYDSVYEFCEKLTKSSRIVEFKEIRKLMQDKANKQGIEIPQSDYNNLIRKLSNKFKELRLFHQEHNKLLVFPAALTIEDLVSEYYTVLNASLT